MFRNLFSFFKVDENIVKLSQASDRGDVDAQRELGFIYSQGIEKKQNFGMSRFFFRKAAEQGDACAQAELGRMYYKGIGVEKNNNQAYLWVNKSLKQGNAEAQFIHGLMHADEQFHKDERIAQSEINREEWNPMVSDTNAIYNVGKLEAANLKKHEQPENYQIAEKYWRKAAAQGHVESCYMLGLLYNRNDGAIKDYKESIKWYKKAGELGHEEAQYTLAQMYEAGHFVAQDYEESAKWCQKAAAQGNERAQNTLAHMYEDGHGVKKSYETSYMW